MTIDFQNTIKNPADRVTYEMMIKLKDHFKSKDDMRLAFLVYFLFRTGRRVSEIVGKYPYNPFGEYPGFRECDINYEINMIKFGILKKNHIKKRDKRGKLKSKEFYKEQIKSKKPKWVWFEFDQNFMDALKWYIDYAKKNDLIGKLGEPDDRIFSFSRVYLHKAIRKASIESNTYLPIIKNNKPRPIHLHAFRHGLASHLIKYMNKAQDLITLKQILAHSDFRMTETYVNLFGGEQKDLYNKAFGEDLKK